MNEYLMLNRDCLRAERWLFANNVPMRISEGESGIEHTFHTDEGLEITMVIYDDDTNAFFFKVNGDTAKDVKPCGTGNRFCCFHVIEEGERTFPPILFVTSGDLN